MGPAVRDADAGPRRASPPPPWVATYRLVASGGGNDTLTVNADGTWQIAGDASHTGTYKADGTYLVVTGIDGWTPDPTLADPYALAPFPPGRENLAAAGFATPPTGICGFGDYQDGASCSPSRTATAAA